MLIKLLLKTRLDDSGVLQDPGYQMQLSHSQASVARRRYSVLIKEQELGTGFLETRRQQAFVEVQKSIFHRQGLPKSSKLFWFETKKSVHFKAPAVFMFVAVAINLGRIDRRRSCLQAVQSIQNKQVLEEKVI